jgi:hypothetical protein
MTQGVVAHGSRRIRPTGRRRGVLGVSGRRDLRRPDARTRPPLTA